jgi:hypothetical protein
VGQSSIGADTVVLGNNGGIRSGPSNWDRIKRNVERYARWVLM